MGTFWDRKLISRNALRLAIEVDPSICVKTIKTGVRAFLSKAPI